MPILADPTKVLVQSPTVLKCTAHAGGPPCCSPWGLTLPFPHSILGELVLRALCHIRPHQSFYRRAGIGPPAEAILVRLLQTLVIALFLSPAPSSFHLVVVQPVASCHVLCQTKSPPQRSNYSDTKWSQFMACFPLHFLPKDWYHKFSIIESFTK